LRVAPVPPAFWKKQEELALIYQAKGLSEEPAKTLAGQLIANKQDGARYACSRGVADRPGRAWRLGLGCCRGIVHAVHRRCAIFPVAPYFALAGMLPLLIASLAASGLALVLIGARTALFTGRGATFSRARQRAIGLAAAGVTFGIRKLIGVAVSG
jgi:vacuolar iron transporter family protein